MPTSTPRVPLQLLALDSAGRQALAACRIPDGALVSALEPVDLADLAGRLEQELAERAGVMLLIVDAQDLFAASESTRSGLAALQTRHRLRVLALRGAAPADWSAMRPLTVDEVLPSPPQAEELSAALQRWAELLRLQAGETIASALMATVGDAVMLTDARDCITWVNAQFCALTGYELPEVIGRRPAFMRVGRNQKQELQLLEEALRSSGGWRGEIWNRKKSGEVYAEWLSVTALDGAKGGPVGYLSVLTDITERKMLESDLRRLAYHDALTDLPNRLLLEDRVHTAIAGALRQRGTVALIYLDLDGFKAANDHFGHAFGDQILVEVAHRLVSAVRATDTVARLGGDEFVCLLVDHGSLSNVQTVLDKVRERIELPYRFDGQVAHIGCSIGLAHHPGDGETAAALLTVADARMYEDKRKRDAAR
ncbi:MAG: diguanylate cyclase domain-containing protein [Inhella sp.]